MKTTEKHYKLFKSECRRWIDIFQLNDYDVYFKWEELKGSDANSYVGGHCGNITFTLSKDIGLFDRECIDYIKELAKHETLHCLVGRFSGLARDRYINEGELDSEEEHLVRKLCKIIK